MQFNFFTWLREGVRQSILLGVHDAVEQLGTAPEGARLNQHLLTAIKPEGLPEPEKKPEGRKRLGRSLRDLEENPANAE